METAADSHPLRVGRLLPATLAVVLLVDMATRALPIDRLAFRAWEALTWNATSEVPFRPSAVFETERAFGDLAALANLPAERHYRHERFTTDAHGLRAHRTDHATAPVDVLLLGDSCAVGNGVCDDETVPARMEARGAGRVYNAGGLYPSLERLDALVHRLAMTRGTVLVLHTEFSRHAHRPWVDAPEPAWFSSLVSPFATSKLRIALRRAYRTLEDDVILPNPWREKVLVGRLPGGETMLFHREPYPPPFPLAHGDVAVRNYGLLASELRARGLDLAILLLPGKRTIYGPLALGDADGGAGRAHLSRMEEGLAALGIPALDLSPAFEREAHALLAERTYLYLLDDSHWSPAGIDLAAREALRAFPRLLGGGARDTESR